MAGFFLPERSTGETHEKGTDPALDQVSSRDEFDSLSITEVLDQDPRPTFVIDLDPDESVTVGAKSVSPIFCNSALRVYERLLDVIVGHDTEPLPPAHEHFCNWATGLTKFDDSKDVFPNSFLFFDLIWTGSTVRKRWRLVSGNLWGGRAPSRGLSGIEQRPRERECRELPSKRNFSFSPTDDSGIAGMTALLSSRQANALRVVGASSDNTSNSSQTHRLTLAAPENAVGDWTAPNPKGILSPHIAFARTIQWDHTPLGHMGKWSREFRQIVNLVMLNPRKSQPSNCPSPFYTILMSMDVVFTFPLKYTGSRIL